jgi:hypothetical protein
MVNFKKLNSPEYRERLKERLKEEQLAFEKLEKEKIAHRFMVERLLRDSYDTLNDWEKEFIDSVGRQINRSECGGKYLSEKQVSILERIFEEK